MVWGMGLLAAGSVVLGVAPQLAVNYFLNPILLALGMGAGVHVTWLGLSADAGSFSSTGGLVLALVSLVVGGAIYLVAYAARPVAVRRARRWPAQAAESSPAASRSASRDASRPAIFLRSFRSTGTPSSAGRMWTAFISAFGVDCRRFRACSAWSFAWMERRATVLVVVFAAAIFALAALDRAWDGSSADSGS